MTSPKPKHGFDLARWVILALLAMATLHCDRAIFFTNSSWVHLQAYEAGTADNPYQTRALMIPVLRWAHGVRGLNRIAVWQNQVAVPPEPYTAEKILCLSLGAILLLACGLLLTWVYARRGGATWWLPWALLLEVLYTSFAARSSLANWYPYDLPHLFFCTLAAVAILERRWWPLAVMMPVATLNRETAILWIALWIAARWREQRWTVTAWQSSALAVLWAIAYLPLKLHYAARPLEVQAQRIMNLHYLLGPWSWPQLFSALGFLPLLMLLFRDRMTPLHRRLSIAMAVCSLPILWRGLWTESRIFLDFVPLVVLICAQMVENGGLLASDRESTKSAQEKQRSHIVPVR